MQKETAMVYSCTNISRKLIVVKDCKACNNCLLLYSQCNKLMLSMPMRYLCTHPTDDVVKMEQVRESSEKLGKEQLDLQLNLSSQLQWRLLSSNDRQIECNPFRGDQDITFELKPWTHWTQFCVPSNSKLCLKRLLHLALIEREWGWTHPTRFSARRLA